MPTPRRNSAWRRRLRRAPAVAGLAVVVWLIASYAVAYRLTRRSEPQRPEPVPAITWGTLTPLRLATTDGQDLGAWFIAGRPDRALVSSLCWFRALLV